MLLRFVAGRAGSGKSTWVYEHVMRDMERSGLPVYVVVPELYTLQTEKELLAALGKKGFLQARVTSPSRLAEEVFTQVGQDRRAAVGESGLAMALRAAAGRLGGSLQAFGPLLGSGGFAAGMVRLISEMKRCDVSADELLAASRSAGGALGAKARDIAAIFREYDGYLQSHSFMDAEDRFDGFIGRIAQSDFLKGCSFYFDGFDLLPPQHCRMIGELVAVAGSVCVTLDYDGFESGDADLFRAAEKNAARLGAIAQELGADVIWVHLRADDRRSAMPPDVAHLERNLFAWTGSARPALGGVTLCRASDAAEEAEAAAAWIAGKARAGGLRWREFAVQCGDLNAYGPVVARVFGRHGIPVFIDSRKPVAGHPAIRFILSAVRLVERDFRADDALRFVKTGYAGIPADAADRLEVYLAAFAPRGAKAWSKDWTRGQDAYDLADVNRSREVVYSAVQELLSRAGGSKAEGSRWARALYELLLERKLDERLDAKAAELKRAGLLEEAAVSGRVWNAVVDVLDQLDGILGGEAMDAGAFRAILQSGFESAEEGILPTGVDQVQVGSIGRSKHSGLRHMLILGAAEGLTDSRDAAGILTGRDIDALAELGVEVGRGSALASSQKRFALYEAVTKGSEGLYISWPASAGTEGGRPDRIVERIIGLLGIGPEGVLAGSELAAGPGTAGGGFGRLPALVRAAAEGTPPVGNGLSALGWFLASAEYGQKTWEMARNAAGSADSGLLPALGPALGGVASVSASQLESFWHCPFRHFVDYALTPQPWRESAVRGADAGRYLHAAMERFSQRLSALRFDVSGMGEQDAAALMRGESERLAGEFEFGLLRRSARLQWTGGNLERICSVAAVSFFRQLKAGAFRPYGQELRFGRGGLPAALLPMADGAPCFLQGRIDRLDVCGACGEDLLRVVDYKSGGASIDARDAVNGLDMQTWLYLYALRALWEKAAGRPARPAGAYVFPLADPWVEEGPEADRELRKALRLKGWCLKDEGVVRAMDESALAGRSELFNFNLSRGTGVHGEAAVEATLGYVLKNATAAVADIRRGRAEAHPWRSGGDTACGSCPYGALCRFDVRAEKPYRRLLDRETVEAMLGGGGEAGADGMDG